MIRDLEKELRQLNIVSIECCGVGTKDDVLACIDAIRDHISTNPDSSKLSRMKESLVKREARAKVAATK